MRLLLLGCSQSKVRTCGRLPAFQRYDGPAYRVFRKFLREHPDADLPVDLYILSAQYGLISGDILIPDYDLRMTAERAAKLKPAVKRSLDLILSLHSYDEIFVAMGKVYREALMDLLPSGPRVVVADGKIGEKSAALYRWLRVSPRGESRRER